MAQEDERRSPRSKVFLSAVLEGPDGTVPVVLRDLSEHGALVETEGGIPLDAEVLFCRRGLRVSGYVAWVRGQSAGIAFSRPLKADVLLQQISRPPSRARGNDSHRRPGVAAKNMSSEEQRWFDEMTREPPSIKRRT